MNIDLPENLVNTLESMDRQARAYGWSVATYGRLEDVVPQYAENPFNDPNWRDKIGWTRPYPTDHYANDEQWRDYIYGGVKNGVLILTTDLLEQVVAETFIQLFIKNHSDAPDDFMVKTFYHDGTKVINVVLKKDVPSVSVVEEPAVDDQPMSVKSCAKVLDNEHHDAHEWGIFDTKTQQTTSYWCDGSQIMASGAVVYLDIDEKQKHVLHQGALNELIGDTLDGIRDNAGNELISSEELVTFSVTKDDLVQAVHLTYLHSCAECPYGTHLDPEEQWRNDATEAFFSCSLGLGENPERQWGEYAPCDEDRLGGYAKRILAVIGFDVSKYMEEGNDGPKIDVNDV